MDLNSLIAACRRLVFDVFEYFEMCRVTNTQTFSQFPVTLTRRAAAPGTHACMKLASELQLVGVDFLLQLAESISLGALVRELSSARISADLYVPR